MLFAKKVAIAINLSQPLPETFSSVKDLSFLQESEIHLVYIQHTTSYAIGLGESSIVYPMEEDQQKIKESVELQLKEISKTILPKTSKQHVHCFFSDDPKGHFCDFVEQNKLDTIIVVARKKRGLFESSFAQYVNKHTSANIIILK